MKAAIEDTERVSMTVLVFTKRGGWLDLAHGRDFLTSDLRFSSLLQHRVF